MNQNRGYRELSKYANFPTRNVSSLSDRFQGRKDSPDGMEEEDSWFESDDFEGTVDTDWATSSEEKEEEQVRLPVRARLGRGRYGSLSDRFGKVRTASSVSNKSHCKRWDYATKYHGRHYETEKVYVVVENEEKEDIKFNIDGKETTLGALIRKSKHESISYHKSQDLCHVFKDNDINHQTVTNSEVNSSTKGYKKNRSYRKHKRNKSLENVCGDRELVNYDSDGLFSPNLDTTIKEKENNHKKENRSILVYDPSIEENIENKDKHRDHEKCKKSVSAKDETQHNISKCDKYKNSHKELQSKKDKLSDPIKNVKKVVTLKSPEQNDATSERSPTSKNDSRYLSKSVHESDWNDLLKENRPSETDEDELEHPVYKRRNNRCVRLYKPLISNMNSPSSEEENKICNREISQRSNNVNYFAHKEEEKVAVPKDSIDKPSQKSKYDSANKKESTKVITKITWNTDDEIYGNYGKSDMLLAEKKKIKIKGGESSSTFPLQIITENTKENSQGSNKSKRNRFWRNDSVDSDSNWSESVDDIFETISKENYEKEISDVEPTDENVFAKVNGTDGYVSESNEKGISFDKKNEKNTTRSCISESNEEGVSFDEKNEKNTTRSYISESNEKSISFDEKNTRSYISNSNEKGISFNERNKKNTTSYVSESNEKSTSLDQKSKKNTTSYMSESNEKGILLDEKSEKNTTRSYISELNEKDIFLDKKNEKNMIRNEEVFGLDTIEVKQEIQIKEENEDENEKEYVEVKLIKDKEIKKEEIEKNKMEVNTEEESVENEDSTNEEEIQEYIEQLKQIEKEREEMLKKIRMLKKRKERESSSDVPCKTSRSSQISKGIVKERNPLEKDFICDEFRKSCSETESPDKKSKNPKVAVVKRGFKLSKVKPRITQCIRKRAQMNFKRKVRAMPELLNGSAPDSDRESVTSSSSTKEACSFQEIGSGSPVSDLPKNVKRESPNQNTETKDSILKCNATLGRKLGTIIFKNEGNNSDSDEKKSLILDLNSSPILHSLKNEENGTISSNIVKEQEVKLEPMINVHDADLITILDESDEDCIILNANDGSESKITQGNLGDLEVKKHDTSRENTRETKKKLMTNLHLDGSATHKVGPKLHNCVVSSYTNMDMDIYTEGSMDLKHVGESKLNDENTKSNDCMMNKHPENNKTVVENNQKIKVDGQSSALSCLKVMQGMSLSISKSSNSRSNLLTDESNSNPESNDKKAGIDVNISKPSRETLNIKEDSKEIITYQSQKETYQETQKEEENIQSESKMSEYNDQNSTKRDSLNIDSSHENMFNAQRIRECFGDVGGMPGKGKKEIENTVESVLKVQTQLDEIKEKAKGITDIQNSMGSMLDFQKLSQCFSRIKNALEFISESSEEGLNDPKSQNSTHSDKTESKREILPQNEHGKVTAHSPNPLHTKVPMLSQIPSESKEDSKSLTHSDNKECLIKQTLTQDTVMCAKKQTHSQNAVCNMNIEDPQKPVESDCPTLSSRKNATHGFSRSTLDSKTPSNDHLKHDTTSGFALSINAVRKDSSSSVSLITSNISLETSSSIFSTGALRTPNVETIIPSTKSPLFPPISTKGKSPLLPSLTIQGKSPLPPPLNIQGKSPNLPPLNIQGKSPNLPLLNIQGKSNLPPLDTQGKSPNLPPLDTQGKSPLPPPINTQGKSPLPPPIYTNGKSPLPPILIPNSYRISPDSTHVSDDEGFPWSSFKVIDEWPSNRKLQMTSAECYLERARHHSTSSSISDIILPSPLTDKPMREIFGKNLSGEGSKEPSLEATPKVISPNGIDEVNFYKKMVKLNDLPKKIRPKVNHEGDNSRKLLFHSRTLRKGKGVEPRPILLYPIHLSKPYDSKGNKRIPPSDPRSGFYERRKAEEIEEEEKRYIEKLLDI